jgi:hypothetical protein
MLADHGLNIGRWQMRRLSQFFLRVVRTLALLLLALTLARPVAAQTTAPDETIQVIAQQQKMISQTYKLERAAELVMHMETLDLLAVYGGWETQYNENWTNGNYYNVHLAETVSQLRPELIYAKTAVQRIKGVSEDELERFSDIYLEVENLFAVADDVYVLVKDGKIDEANALYRDKSIPLNSSIKADSYPLISGLEEKIDKAALHARLAK